MYGNWLQTAFLKCSTCAFPSWSLYYCVWCKYSQTCVVHKLSVLNLWLVQLPCFIADALVMYGNWLQTAFLKCSTYAFPSCNAVCCVSIHKCVTISYVTLASSTSLFHCRCTCNVWELAPNSFFEMLHMCLSILESVLLCVV